MAWDKTPIANVVVSPTDLRHLVDALPDAVLVADNRGSVRFANQAAAQLLETKVHELVGSLIPFSPSDDRFTLPNEVNLRLDWAQTYWEGNQSWLVVARGVALELSPAPSSPEREHRAIQAELRCEQLQEQLHRLQEQLAASDDLRHEQTHLLSHRQHEVDGLQAQLEDLQQRLNSSENRAQEAESLALQQWEQSQQQFTDVEQRLSSALTELARAEDSEKQLRGQLQEASQRVGPPTQLELQSQQAQRRLSEQLSRIQGLEAELEGLRERATPRDDSAWEELRQQAVTSRDQAVKAEQRAANLEQRLYDQEQRAQELNQRSEALVQRLGLQEEQAEQIRRGLEQQLLDLSAEEQQAKRLAFEDQLTHLPNLNILQQYLDFTSGLVERNEGAAILMLIDIDRLRSVNSTLGQAAGDDLLRQFAARLKGLCRNTDVLGRRGDDEFLVVVAHRAVDSRELALARTTVVQMAQSLAGKVQGICQEPFQLEGSPVQISCSIGMTMFGEASTEEVLQQVQVALDRARELGRNRFHFFGPELHDRLRSRQAIVPRLVEALERQEFALFYQPIIDLRNGKAVGVEALLRWHDPKLGMLTPGEFLGAAEESGLIVPIGEWAVQEACLLAAQHKELFVSVNLSPRQLMHGDFPRRFMKAIERARVKPERIVVEISEATSSADPERVSQVLAELARWNVGLAIDDFGKGSSSLLRLQREKPRFLKIDTAFVSQLPDDKTSFHIVLAACHLATSLQMQSLAEGVETEQQLQTLKRMGCQLAQGRHLSPPVAATQLRELVRKTWKL